MKEQFRLPVLALLAAAAGALFSSCAYDPYHYSTSSTVGYSSNGRVSSSIFISTGNSRWGYDPHCRSYFDFTRQCYYDPYLLGYYPRGYRPPVIVGVPHPHGWRTGQSICPPPSHVRNHTLSNYHNRHQHYSNLNHAWARDLRRHSSSNQSHSNWNNPSHHNGHPVAHSNSIWNRTNNGYHQTTPQGTNRNSQPNHAVDRGRSGYHNGNSHNNTSSRQPQPGNRSNSTPSNRSNSNQSSAQRNQPSIPTTRNYPTATNPSPGRSLGPSAAPDPQKVSERVATIKQSMEQAKANGTLKRR